MKRRYKPGDWFRVPLGAACDAIGVITHACRSRLFVYFFAAPVDRDPSFEELKALRPQHAKARFLVGGAPIESLRWPVLATSVPFDAALWPFPSFVHRGAFGRTWTVRTYDPETMQRTGQHASSADAAWALPPAHFLNEDECETELRECIAGIAPAQPAIVCEIRTPLDLRALEPLASGGRVQCAQPLHTEIVAEIAQHAGAPAELRLHSMYAWPFDLRVLSAWRHLRALTIDTTNVLHPHALDALGDLFRLRLPANVLQKTPPLASVRDLSVYGDGSAVALHAWPNVEELTVENARVDLRDLAETPVRALVLRHCAFDPGALAALNRLLHVEIASMQLRDAEAIARAPRVASLVLRDIRLLHDLAPLAKMPHLRELRVTGMPQLRASDFAALAARGDVLVLSDSGNRTFDREIHRTFAANAGARIR